MNLLAAVCLISLLLVPLAGTAAEPPQACTLSCGVKVEAGRIAIRDGRLVDKGTGKPFRPVGVHSYRSRPDRGGQTRAHGLQPRQL